VTGSPIAQPNLTSVSPVTAVSSDQIKIEGVTRTEDLINVIPTHKRLGSRSYLDVQGSYSFSEVGVFKSLNARLGTTTCSTRIRRSSDRTRVRPCSATATRSRRCTTLWDGLSFWV
jgi:hypothetical protein